MTPKFTVRLWTSHGHHSTVIHTGNDETVMYSHVNTIEYTLQSTYATADIEIIEDDLSRWIDYRNGKRV